MIKSISLHNFRNVGNKTYDLNNNLIIFVGNNGVGKTSILEAIYLCTTSKSHRTNNFKDLIRFNNSNSEVLLKTDNRYLSIYLGENKSYFINGKKVNNLEFINNIHTVIFSNLDLNYITGSKSLKLKYVDMMISLINTNYLKLLIEYKKIIKERNSLLKKIQIDKIYLKVLDEKLIEYIFYINKYRNKFYRLMNEQLEMITKELKIESIYIDFKLDKTIENIASALQENFPNDLKYKRTTYGPHSDYIEFIIDNKNANKFASQGQIRSIAIAMKLGLVKIMNLNKIEPILLLDDVFAELDENRQRSLIKYLNNVQTLITTTSLSDIPKELLDKAKIYTLRKD